MKRNFLRLVILCCSFMFACEKKTGNFLQEQNLQDTKQNSPPKAIAGNDQYIRLPLDSALLDGNSSDPDGNVSSYLWSKILGPSSFQIVEPTRKQTTVRTLVAGTYQFELSVTDSGGLTGRDTLQITVQAAGISASCNNRPEINASLIPIATLSQARFGLVAGTAGSKILFAGGWTPGAHSSRVDIYDTITHSWTTSELTLAERDGMAVGTVGSKIFFAGGGNNDWIDVTSRIDIFDASTNTWSTAELSTARNYLAVATLGNKIFFAGGGVWGPLTPGSTQNYHIGTNVVDVYDNSTNTWSMKTLSAGRFELSATTVGNKIYFAGGLHSIFSGSNEVDIYDASADSWSVSQMQEVKASHSGMAIGNKIFWAGGAKTSYQNGYQLSDLVEIKDVVTNTSSFDCITPKAMFASVRMNDDIIFFTGYNNGPANKFDIYHMATNSWSIGVLPVSIRGTAIISVNNTIYVAGGDVNGSYSNQVWKLEF